MVESASSEAGRAAGASPPPLCVGCEYVVRGIAPDGACPECGIAVAESRGVGRSWSLRRLKWTRWVLVALAAAALLPMPYWLMTLSRTFFGGIDPGGGGPSPLWLLAWCWWPASIAAALFALGARPREGRRPNEQRWVDRRWACLVIGAIVVTAVFDIGVWVAWLTGQPWLGTWVGESPMWLIVTYSLRPLVALVILVAPYLVLFPAAAFLRPAWASVIGLAVLCAACATVVELITMAGIYVGWESGIVTDVSVAAAHWQPFLQLVQIALSAAIVVALLPPLLRRERAIRDSMAVVGSPMGRTAPSTTPS